jgi:hypothetical protein
MVFIYTQRVGAMYVFGKEGVQYYVYIICMIMGIQYSGEKEVY